jgi:alpha-beta hydrolase superfamily lysophospholipase
MNCVEFEWTSADGVRLFGCGWRADDKSEVKGVVGIVHGMGEHSGRYIEVAEALTAAGYAVLAADQRGHGKTEGKRGHIPSYEALLEGVDLLLKEARQRYPDVPCFLYGHSMGGNVVLNYLIRRKPALSGAIVTGPWLKLAFEPSAKDLMLGRIMDRIYPQFTSHRPSAVEKLTSDPEAARKITEDPLGHRYITARCFFSLLRGGRYALEHAAEIAVPVLLLHGVEDSVTSLSASRAFAESMGDLCTFKELAGYRHELHNELYRQQVFHLMLTWLEKAGERNA